MSGCSRQQVESHEGHDHHGEESAEHGHLELSQRQINTVGIEFGHFEEREIGTGIRANGVLSVNPQDVAEVTPLIAGILKSIKVTEGQTVKAGSVVATIENLEVVGYQRDYRNALEELKLAESELARQQRLAAAGAGVRKNLEKAGADVQSARTLVASLETQLSIAGINPADFRAGASSAYASVKAPISGIVNKIFVNTGGVADMSRPLMTITDNSKIFALITVYEKDVEDIRPGQKVELTITNGRGRLEGEVETVNRSIDPESRGIGVKVRLTGDVASGLIPGMAVGAYINAGGELTRVLPEDAVVSVGGKDYIYVLEDENEEDGEKMYHFEAMEVMKGKQQQGYVEVKPMGELPEDATVVTRKAFYIASMAADHGEHNH